MTTMRERVKTMADVSNLGRSSGQVHWFGNNINHNYKGRNNGSPQEEDFSNSFIEGKSFNANNSKRPSVAEKGSNKDLPPPSAGESELSEQPRNVRDLDRNSKVLDIQNKMINSASIGPYPIG